MSPVLAPRWPDQPARVRAAFTLRGPEGASGGPYARFNIATHVGDAPDAVAANRRQLTRELRLPGEPVWMTQVHGIEVLDADAAADRAPLQAADASVSRAPGRVCTVQVADCLPVLLASKSGARVGAAHAGWRGLAAGVLEATIRALGVPPTELTAWIGPGISQAHFEVGDDVRNAFVQERPGAEGAFVRNGRGRWQCDLAGLAADRLRLAGVASVSIEGACTYADRGRFFSYRRDGQCGRMAGLIWLER